MSLIPDPSEQDKFQNHRAGYGDAAFERMMKVARKGGTLAAGEGKALIEYYECQLKQEKIDHDTAIRLVRLERDSWRGRYEKYVLALIEPLHSPRYVEMSYRIAEQYLEHEKTFAKAFNDAVAHMRREFMKVVKR